MFCKYCGKELNEGDTFCAQCGKTVAELTNAQPASPEQQKKSNFNVLALLGFIFAFCIPIAGLICSIIGYKQANNYKTDLKGMALAGIIISAVEIFLLFY